MREFTGERISTPKGDFEIEGYRVWKCLVYMFAILKANMTFQKILACRFGKYLDFEYLKIPVLEAYVPCKYSNKLVVSRSRLKIQI